jgi:hypothetical protein
MTTGGEVVAAFSDQAGVGGVDGHGGSSRLLGVVVAAVSMI